MTLWNPLNVFSGKSSTDEGHPVEGTAASYDPSRVGDPLGSPLGAPAIGYGDTRVGTGVAGPSDPHRNPIGFAPPLSDVPDTPARFRTEISFRRHHELPRASAMPLPPDEDARIAWQSPELDAPSTEEAEVHEAHETEHETRTPFFRREISFRRKKSDGVSPEAEVVDVWPSVDEPDGDAVADVDPDAEVETADVEHLAVRHEDAPFEDAPSENAPIEDAPSVDAVHEVHSHDDVADAAEETEAVEIAEPVAKAVPFYKREIGFRRKQDDAVAADDVEASEPEVAARLSMEHEVVAEAPAQEPAADADAPEHEATDSTDEPALSGQTEVAAKVPFHKRELSFRRKKNVAEEAAAVVAADAVATDEAPEHATDAVVEPDAELAPADIPVMEVETEHEPVLDEAEPSFETSDEADLSYEKSVVEEHPPIEVVADSTEAVAEAESWPAEAAPEHDAVAEAADQPVEGEHVAEGFTLPPVAVDDNPFEDAATLPAADVEDAVAADELPTDAVDEAGDDSGESKGRFSRKEKAPKRQRSGGNKGGRKIVGLKIGASQIAAAVIAETDAGRELVALSRRPLAAGIVVDGEVRDEVALASAVKAFFDEEKLPKSDVRLGLSSNRIGVRTLDIDGVDDESRFDNAVRFKAHEVLPVALSESLLDYRVLETRLNEEGEETRRVLLVVAPRDQVSPYQRVAAQAGIKLSAIDLEALGLLRAFVEPGFGVQGQNDTATVVIAIGHESSTLLVSGGGSCEFTRVFDWGGSALEDAIAASLEVRPAEAATILRHLSLSGPGRQYTSLTDEARAKATDAIRQRLTPFARELVNSLQFYQTQSESLGIGGILVTGGTSHLEGLDNALHQMIGVDVSIGNPLARINHVAELDSAIEAGIGSLAVSIGLAIDDLPTRTVNLLPKNDQTKKSSSRSTLLSIGIPVAAAVPLAALSILYLGAHGKVADNQSQLDAVKAEIATLPPPKAPVIDAGVAGDEAARATAVAQVLGGRLAWDKVFSDMARVLPGNVWLSTLQLTQPAPQNLADGTAAPPPASPVSGGVTAPSAVSIDGFTYTQPDVARLLARLATLPSLQRVTLQSSQSQLIGTKPVVHFIIVADLNQTGGVS